MNKKNIIGIIAMLLVSALCAYFGYARYQAEKRSRQQIEEFNKDFMTYKKVFNETDFASLEKENKELYDSLKMYKDEINYLARFRYSKTYSTDTVWTITDESRTDTIYEQVPMPEGPVMSYEYAGGDPDSISYKLTIGSTRRPDWYKLDVALNDNITLVNKSVGGYSETTIQSQNGAVIGDATLFNKPNKRTFWDRVAVGPSVTVGYDPVMKGFGAMVGFSVTYDLKK